MNHNGSLAHKRSGHHIVHTTYPETHLIKLFNPMNTTIGSTPMVGRTKAHSQTYYEAVD